MSKPNQPVREVIGTWWTISSYNSVIESVQVVACTASFMTIKEKVRSLGGADRYREVRRRRDDAFPSFAEAKDEAIRRATLGVTYAVAELHRKRTFLGNLESLQAPVEEVPNV